uniref:Nucleotidyltransferase domain-containing protein n=1 Tax=Desulfatirhabdium butyrativorans TaxID=340467 RepID=A0A7C4RQU3_9BACT
MKDAFGLKRETTDRIRSVLAKYPQIDRAILYGSRAKGNYKPGSDIDLTIVGGPGLTFDSLTAILNDIDELLLPYTFDLSIFQEIEDPDIVDHILRVGVVFYERNHGDRSESVFATGNKTPSIAGVKRSG